MKRLLIAGVIALTLIGCGGGTKTATDTTADRSATNTSTSATTGCASSGLDAMTALSDFQLEMDQAQKDGKLTVDQLLAARDKLYNQTQEAQKKEDWAAYCKAIDDMRAELKL